MFFILYKDLILCMVITNWSSRMYKRREILKSSVMGTMIGRPRTACRFVISLEFVDKLLCSNEMRKSAFDAIEVSIQVAYFWTELEHCKEEHAEFTEIHFRER
ncbi:hypothetical protein EL22_28945 [Halostagnicola sp. A56]|nr:hypothetical protein EL22_28945 [Halostagnicola sp. A56]